MAMRSKSVLSIEVPVIVYLAERSFTTAEIMRLVPGSIIEMAKQADKDLDLYISNRRVGTGTAVKVGENFGLRVTSMIEPVARLEAALDDAAVPPEAPAPTETASDSPAEAEAA